MLVGRVPIFVAIVSTLSVISRRAASRGSRASAACVIVWAPIEQSGSAAIFRDLAPIHDQLAGKRGEVEPMFIRQRAERRVRCCILVGNRS